MKKALYYEKLKLIGFLSLMFFLAISNVNFAQHIVHIAPGPPGTFNNTIEGDTASDGTHPDAVYQLDRGGIYLYTATIENNYKITLEAVGSGPMPIIQPASQPGGAKPPKPFQPYNDITVKGIMFYAYDNSIPPIAATNGFIRVSSDSTTIRVDSCRFDGNVQEALRCNNPGDNIIVTNSTFSNNYDPNSPNDGWIIFTRNTLMDTVLFSNCTFYNTDYWSKKPFDDKTIYYKIVHCTFDNFSATMKTIHPDSLSTPSTYETERYGSISAGAVTYFVFRDNLMVNPAFIGTETPSHAQGLILRYIVNIDSMYNDSTKSLVAPAGVDIRNNDIWLDPNFTYPDSMEAYPKSQWYDPTATEFINKEGTESTLLNVDPGFKNAPAAPQQYSNDWFAENENMAHPPFYMPETSFDPNSTVGLNSLDFSYSNSQLMSASTQGQPLGDLRWFNMTPKTTEDQLTSLTAVNSETSGLPQSFVLRQNYPNPFNPTTVIEYSIPKAGNVSITVFNVLGQNVATLVNGFKSAGNYSAVFNGTNLSSGVYFYKLQTGNLSIVKKMMLMK